MRPFSLNIRGRIVSFSQPVLMGIINATPDSFFAGSRVQTEAAVIDRALKMVREGADILDVGAYSSRPGADDVSEAEECRRLEVSLRIIRKAVGDDIPISVDTFRASVARKCIEHWGADIVNDISGGALDEDMFETVASMRCPYILMHMRGTPSTMQSMTDYKDVTADVIAELSRPLNRLEDLGVSDIIIDPGFGFAKTLEQNYELMRNLRAFEILGRPILVGVSRKSMITKLLNITTEEAELPTAILGAVAVERGAGILRVHDVAAARQSINLLNAVEPCLVSE